MLFDTVIVHVVSPATVLISAAAMFAEFASLRVTFPGKVSPTLPANAALISDVEPDKATALLLRVIFPVVPLLIVTSSARRMVAIKSCCSCITCNSR